MKNKLHSGEVGSKKYPLARIAFLIVFFVFSSTTNLWAQKVTLIFSQTRLERVLDEISRQTHYTFAFSPEVVDVTRNVSIRKTNADLKEVLTELFAGTRISYRIADRKIFLADRATMKQEQTWTVSGKISDEQGSPIVGATILLQGTTRGTTSNADGSYRITVRESDRSPVLLFSFIGYDLQQIPVSPTRSIVNVTMRASSTAIQDVVVTALGITRQEQSLGYAVSKVDNEALNTTVSSNWLNSLSGKVAGLNLEGTSSGPGGSLRVTLRGEGSLSHDKNTALFVVDGIPISSDMTASSSASQTFDTDAPIDYGNGASDLNPEDIESVSVLKGPAATALYGSRAANGAIIITTKSGRTTKDGLQEYNIYKINNSRSTPLSYVRRSNKSVNSFYGLVNLSWRDMIFLDITGRNDWSSALARGNNSYFYPSVSTSILLDRLLNLGDSAPWINMLKIRGSWANVGNDTSPYSLNHVYSSSNFASAYYLSSTIQNPDIKPENVESFEVGTEVHLFDNIWSFDATYYHSSTTDQIIGVPVDQVTGATSKLINAGEVRNEGVELSTRIVPIRTKDTRWEINLNWSKNWNRLVSLAPGVEVWQMNSNMNVSGNIYINAYPGTELGRLYGRGYKRAPQGAFYVDENGAKIDCSGQVIVDAASGAPVLTGTEDPLLDLGSIYPDWKAGMTHTLSYKNLKLSLTFTGQWGGNAYSVTHFALAYQGKLKNSLPGRYAGLIHEGVNLNDDGTYRRNTTITKNIVDYYSTYVYPSRDDYRDVGENIVYINVWNWDADWEIKVNDGTRDLPVDQIYQRDPLHTISYDVPRVSEAGEYTQSFASTPLIHLFSVQAPDANTTLTITVTDRFGNVYKEVMSRPKSFSTNSYNQ